MIKSTSYNNGYRVLVSEGLQGSVPKCKGLQRRIQSQPAIPYLAILPAVIGNPMTTMQTV